MVDAQVHIVIDNGTGYMKGGFSGDEAPRCVFPTILGPPIEGALLNTEKKDRLIGQEAFDKYGLTKVLFPIENGVIKNFDEMELIWHKLFYHELNINPEDHNVILTDVPKNDEEKRKEITRRMFEKFNIPGMFIGMTSVMSIYATGKTAGIVIDSGESITNFVPIFEGFAFPHAIVQNNIAGKTITDYLIRLLVEKRYNIEGIQNMQKIKEVKEKYCYISYDFEAEIREAGEGGTLETKVKLPDGEELNLEFERLRCPEALFQHRFIDSNLQGGLHDDCYSSIQKTDVEIRKDLYSNIVLSGGNTLFQGLPERLTKEIQKLTPSAASNKVKVIALPERKYATWIGASILSSLSNFQCMWVTKAEYDEAGPDIICKKCF